MSKKLLAHVEAMQAFTSQYLTPDCTLGPVEYTDRIIYMLDCKDEREAMAEARFDYLAESERTASASFNGELVDFMSFLDCLHEFMQAANNLDRYKKLLFYGEDAKKGRVGDSINRKCKLRGNEIIECLTGSYCERSKAEQAVHAILGVATETGELVEALGIALADPKSGGLDFVNCLEEFGDMHWYEAMFYRITGKTFDGNMRTNIAKLRQRFPDKFNSENANERNLEHERAILENGGAPVHVGNVQEPPKVARPELSAVSLTTHDGNTIQK